MERQGLEKELFEALKTEPPMQTLRCAQTNFETIGERAGLSDNPIWILAKAQLDAAIFTLELDPK